MKDLNKILQEFIDQIQKDAKDKEDIESAYQETISKFQIENPELDFQVIFEAMEYTCFTCKKEKTCPFAYDEYNKEGDCLNK